MQVDTERCVGCGACIEVCPNGAIQLRQAKAWINPDLCTECKTCAEVCPQGSIQASREILPMEAASLSIKAPTISESRSAMVIEPPQYQEKKGAPFRAVLTFLGQEILPRAIDLFLTRLEERRNSTLTPYSKASIHQGRSIFPNDFISSHPARYRHRFSQRKNKNWTISNNASRN